MSGPITALTLTKPGQWLWLSWLSGHFQYQRSAVWTQSSAKFYNVHVNCWKDKKTKKEAGNVTLKTLTKPPQKTLSSFTQSTIRWLVENEDANKCFCQVACSHTRAIELYIESLKSRDCLFIGHRCDSYEDFKKVWTAFSPTAKMALKHDLFRCLKALIPIIWVQLELKSETFLSFYRDSVSIAARTIKIAPFWGIELTNFYRSLWTKRRRTSSSISTPQSRLHSVVSCPFSLHFYFKQCDQMVELFFYIWPTKIFP